jgi:CDP-paratose 2-epimerase
MADVVIVTGSAGLVGAETARFYLERGRPVVGIDNDMRARFFGAEASTRPQRDSLLRAYPETYTHVDADIRDQAAVQRVFKQYGSAIGLVVHTAAQPSHDWAASDPQADFTVNANGTLNLLEATRAACPEAVFIHVSTNKVYGDTPNRLPLIEQDTRWELDPAHPYAAHGIDETMSIDRTTHSLFGASKAAGDLLAQEYGRYFGMNVGVFRGGCLTGPGHAGTRLHGFLSYLMKCAISGRTYTVYGYGGKQVRDNIHSLDLIRAFDAFAATEKLSRTHIRQIVSFMSGLPGVAEEEMECTYRLMDRLAGINPRIYLNGVFLYTPYPGTELFAEVTQEYGYKAPASLDQWADFGIYRNTGATWLSTTDLAKYKTISILTRFPFWKQNVSFQDVKDAVGGSRFARFPFNIVYYCFARLASWRWRHRRFRFGFEWRLIEWVLVRLRGYV